jgi:hypothetical protein
MTHKEFWQEVYIACVRNERIHDCTRVSDIDEMAMKLAIKAVESLKAWEKSQKSRTHLLEDAEENDHATKKAGLMV